MSTLKQRVLEMLKEQDAEELQFSEFENLVLDEMPIGSLSELDREFLESFTAMEQLSLQQCELKTLTNLPRSNKVYRVDLSKNLITGDQLENLF